MVAINKGYVEEMDALLEGGADVNATHKVYYKKNWSSHLLCILSSCGVISSQGMGWTAIIFFCGKKWERGNCTKLAASQRKD